MSNENKPASDPATALRFAVIKDLTASGRHSPKDTMNRLRELLASTKLRGTLHLQLLEGGDPKNAATHTVTLGAEKPKTGSKATAKRTVELITTPEIWAQIASGRLAPHDAFLSGRMRVRGSAALAQTMLRHVAASDGLTTLCREEEA